MKATRSTGGTTTPLLPFDYVSTTHAMRFPSSFRGGARTGGVTALAITPLGSSDVGRVTWSVPEIKERDRAEDLDRADDDPGDDARFMPSQNAQSSSSLMRGRRTCGSSSSDGRSWHLRATRSRCCSPLIETGRDTSPSVPRRPTPMARCEEDSVESETSTPADGKGARGGISATGPTPRPASW